MNLKDIAFEFNVKAVGYDEKAEIVQAVAKEMGRKGVVELARLTGHTAKQFQEYGTLKKFFEDTNRRRRQRKPKQRVTEEMLVPIEIRRALEHWENTNESYKNSERA